MVKRKSLKVKKYLNLYTTLVLVIVFKRENTLLKYLINKSESKYIQQFSYLFDVNHKYVENMYRKMSKFNWNKIYLVN